jgi:hypothetical protein
MYKTRYGVLIWWYYYNAETYPNQTQSIPKPERKSAKFDLRNENLVVIADYPAPAAATTPSHQTNPYYQHIYTTTLSYTFHGHGRDAHNPTSPSPCCEAVAAGTSAKVAHSGDDTGFAAAQQLHSQIGIARRYGLFAQWSVIIIKIIFHNQQV